MFLKRDFLLIWFCGNGDADLSKNFCCCYFVSSDEKNHPWARKSMLQPKWVFCVCVFFFLVTFRVVCLEYSNLLLRYSQGDD